MVNTVLGSNDASVSGNVEPRQEQPTAAVDVPIMESFLSALARELGQPKEIMTENLRTELEKRGALFRNWVELNDIIQVSEEFGVSASAESIQYIAQAFAALMRDVYTQTS